MRHHASLSDTKTPSDWRPLLALCPYFWQYKWRVFFALSCLFFAKISGFYTPIILKKIVDRLSNLPLADPSQVAILTAVPLALLLAYGFTRLSVNIFNELREIVFARVTQRTARTIALKVFSHLHTLSLRFHLSRQTGGLTRDIERGTRAISSLTSYLLYSIAPTILEISLVMAYMAIHYDRWFLIITTCALIAYILFTISVTEWRTHLRREMNNLDARANTQAIDALINFETVKYFDQVNYEARRYDQHLAAWENAAVKSQTSLSLLNLGQALIVVIAVTLVMWRAVLGVNTDTMSVGDLVLVNVFLLQLYIPLNFLGVLYREIKQGLIDLERLLKLLNATPDITDAPGAINLQTTSAEISFNEVDFAYEADREVLRKVSFTVPAGTTLAIVGGSGAGKSTLSKLLFRFYDVTGGRISINRHDLRTISQTSLRALIGIVPQDTVLFNDTIGYNIRYGRPDCSAEEMIAAAKKASIHEFIISLPKGYESLVGERGLKLSGGEKQRVAIARTLLKNPAILILDEATAALDSVTEKEIQKSLELVAKDRTTLIIAHRLSTITHAEQIIVMSEGRIIERGHHTELLSLGGVYADLWQKQSAEKSNA